MIDPILWWMCQQPKPEPKTTINEKSIEEVFQESVLVDPIKLEKTVDKIPGLWYI